MRRLRRKQAALLAQGATKGKCGAPGPTPCTPDSLAVTCANTCGDVVNNCGQTVNCGACTCTPDCDVCLTCIASGSCVPDQTQQGAECGEDDICCSGVCVGTKDPNNCQGCGVVCADGEDCCDVTGCVDLQTDNGNCGSCNNPCAGGQSCVKGVCEGVCDPPCGVCETCNSSNTCEADPAKQNQACGTGSRCCSGNCIDVSSDINNCGGCDNVCVEPGAVCTGGICGNA